MVAANHPAQIVRLQRQIDLANAQTAAAEGRTADARALFARHGISYCPAVRS